ncbi:MAG: YciI family protein [Pseudomonadota bacterium]
MPRYIFAYHGGSTPSTPEAGAKEMAKWDAWFAAMPAGAVSEEGAPVGKSTTVSAGGVADDGGPNPLSGYSIVEASDAAEAVEIAKGCPIVGDGGSVEIAPIMAM